MSVGAGAVTPGVAPEGAGHDQRDRRLSEARLTAAGRDEDTAQVTRAQLAQTVVLGGVVVDARRQIGQIAAHEVQLEVVARARRARGAKLDDSLPDARDVPAVEQAVRQASYLSQHRAIGHRSVPVRVET